MVIVCIVHFLFLNTVLLDLLQVDPDADTETVWHTGYLLGIIPYRREIELKDCA